MRLMGLSFFCLFFLPLVASLNEEGFALLLFRQSLEFYPESYLQNWNSNDLNPCSWNGITCREGEVVSLEFPSKNLSGFLSPSLGNLSSLSHLNLRNNNFSGTLPVELFKLRNLRTLVLSGNSLSGSIPLELGNLLQLQNLDLSQNFFNRSIPLSILQCRGLKLLFLSQNNLSGSLPNGFGANVTALQNLNISFNRLSGSIPVDMGSLANLKGVMDLSHNLFTGSIPSSLGNLPEKLYIDLNYNNLSGPIPQNGVLENMGPTAYIGNPLLCGFPLNISCSSLATLNHPESQSLVNFPSKKKDKSQTYSLIALVVGVVMGASSIAFLVSYWYRKVSVCKGSETSACRFKEVMMVKKELFCFAKRDLEKGAENMEDYNFVRLDPVADFELDQLLKASAYLLSKNGNGIVYRVVLEDGRNFVVRRLGDGGYLRFKEFQSEVEAIGKVRHQNVVSLLAYCWSVEEKLLIYEYIPHGDLSTAIYGKTGRTSASLSWSDRLRITKGIAKGLAYLHEFSSRKYVHGDLKPSNILLGQNMEPCIADFGLACLSNITTAECSTPQSEQMLSLTPQQSPPSQPISICSTPTQVSYYQAPEASKTAKPSQKWDVYSYGVILLEIMSGKLPVIQIGSSEMELARWIQLNGNDQKLLLNVLDPSLADAADKNEVASVMRIAMACVHKNPERRPCMRFVYECLNQLTES